MTTPSAPSPGVRQSLTRFVRYVREETGHRAVLALGLLLLSSLAEGGSILMLIPVLQMGGLQGGTITFHPPESLAALLGAQVHLSLALVLGLLVLMVVLQTILASVKNVYLGAMLYDVINRLRTSVFESVGRARWGYVARLRGSDLNHVLTADIDRVQASVFNLFMLVQNVVVLAVYGVVSFLISPWMTLFAGVMGGGAFALLRPVRKYASGYGANLTRMRQQQYRTVSDFLSSMKVAKSLNAEPRYFADLRATLGAMRADYMRFVRLSLVGVFLFQISGAVALAVFVYVALTRFHLPLPQLVVMLLIFLRITPRFQAIQGFIQDLLANLPAFDAIRDIEAACDAEREKRAPVEETLPPLAEAVRFEDVAFSYSGDLTETVVRDVSFRAPARQITAVIGASGSGKSTLADLLMGLLEPTAGRVTIDGVPLDERTRRPWRERIAYVPQEVLLLHDTVAANLRLAAPEADEAAMWEALTAANAHQFVAKLPEGLETVLADRGVRLSGGERQRIALARALLRRPELLILDEATSALDWENQALIARSIESLRGSMTVVTIAHRPSMIAFADWVVALDGGRVVEAGAYDELVRRSGSRLAQLVAGEQGEAAATETAASG